MIGKQLRCERTAKHAAKVDHFYAAQCAAGFWRLSAVFGHVILSALSRKLHHMDVVATRARRSAAAAFPYCTLEKLVGAMI